MCIVMNDIVQSSLYLKSIPSILITAVSAYTYTNSFNFSTFEPLLDKILLILQPPSINCVTKILMSLFMSQRTLLIYYPLIAWATVYREFG